MKNKRIVAFFATVVFLLSFAAQASGLVIIKYYYRANCSWCDKEKPVLERVSANGLAEIEFINCDGSLIPTPTMKIVVNGKVVRTFVGYTEFNELYKVLKVYQ